MSTLLNFLRRALNRRRIKQIEASKVEWRRLQAEYRAAGATNSAFVIELMLVAADRTIRQLSEAA